MILTYAEKPSVVLAAYLDLITDRVCRINALKAENAILRQRIAKNALTAIASPVTFTRIALNMRIIRRLTWSVTKTCMDRAKYAKIHGITVAGVEELGFRTARVHRSTPTTTLIASQETASMS